MGSDAYSMIYWKEKGHLRYDKQPIDDSIGGLIHLGRLQSQPFMIKLSTECISVSEASIEI